MRRGAARSLGREVAGAVGARALLALPLALASALALAADFAALTVSPYGRQSFDLATGLTVLADGGEVLDRERGVRLVGAVIRLQEGAFIELEDARASSDASREDQASFGVVEAEFIRLDHAAQTLVAEGEVRLSGELNASAARLTVFFGGEVIVAEEVASQDPELGGRALVFDLASRTALLVGPYRFEDGPLSLVSAAAEDLLELVLEQGGLRAATEVDPATLARLGPYLPE